MLPSHDVTTDRQVPAQKFTLSLMSSLCQSLFYVLFMELQRCSLCTVGNVSARHGCSFGCIVEKKSSKRLARSRIFYLSNYIKIKNILKSCDFLCWYLASLPYFLFDLLSFLYFCFLIAPKVRTAI